MFAIIKTNSYQYLVSQGDKIVIPADIGEPGKEVEFDKVIMLKDDANAIVGKPYVDGARVKGIVRRRGKLPKVIIYKFIKRENYRRKKGHRQDFCEVEIVDIIKD